MSHFFLVLQSKLIEKYLQKYPDCSKKLPPQLGSYYYLLKSPADIARVKKLNLKIFLDSGAFSSYTKNIAIENSTYLEFIKNNLDIILPIKNQIMAAGLDDLTDFQKSRKNFLEAYKNGLLLIPTVHFGDPFAEIDFYLKYTEVIAIGGLVGKSEDVKTRWLDELWSFILSNKKRKSILYHGFGVRNIKHIKSYPWYSVDSSDWVQFNSIGGILLPPPNYKRILISTGNKINMKTPGRHFISLSKSDQKLIKKEIEKYGFDLFDLQNNADNRYMYSLKIYYEWNKYLESKTSQNSLQKGIFHV